MTDETMVQLLHVVAASLERQNQGESGGLLRQAADRIRVLTGASGGCQHCAGPVDRKPTGRPAKFCSDRCRVAAWRETKGRRSAA